MLPKDTPPVGGLYIIWLSDTHYYGGRAKRFKSRWWTHLRDLRAGRHSNARMQAAFNKYGRFEPKVLLLLVGGEHEDAEQRWLNEHFRKPGCVNLSPHADGGCAGHTTATRQKMSATRASRPDLVERARETLEGNRLHKGERKSAEAVEKIRGAASKRRGVPQPPEIVEKRAASNRGRKNTPETLARMSDSAKKRAAACPPSHGSATRALISTQQRGRVWVNDGERNARVFPDEVPEGWVVGRLPLGPRVR